MRNIESMTNHLHKADRDMLVFAAVRLGVTWAIILLVVALRHIYGCRLGKETQDTDAGPRPSHVAKTYGAMYRPYTGNPVNHQMGDGGYQPEPMMSNNSRRESCGEIPSVKIKVEPKLSLDEYSSHS